MRNCAKRFEIDASHFTGRSHMKGKPAQNAKPTEYYLTKNSNISSGKLRVKLIKDGIKEARCEHCLLTEWQGKPIPLELDHINSDH